MIKCHSGYILYSTRYYDGTRQKHDFSLDINKPGHDDKQTSESPNMTPPPHDSDDSQDDDDDSNLFRQMMKGTRPLQSDTRMPENTRHSTRPQKRHGKPATTSAPLYLDTRIDINKTLFYHRGGLQHAVIKRLKRGEIPYEARLDLHGQRLEQAQLSVQQFIDQSCQAGMHCVLIVHGRGLGSDERKPLLKQAVNQWLPQIPDVLAFASAIPAHGGVGALYVILRRRR